MAPVEAANERPPMSFALRMLGPLTALSDGAELPLPASRKVRALLVFLALQRRPVPRSQLCDLCWEGPNDPRGELRWSLSKLRRIVGPTRLVGGADTVQLDLPSCAVDALELEHATSRGVGAIAPERA